jgi:hypothetical protein
MPIDKKYMIPGVVAAACLIIVCAWKLGPSNLSEVIHASEAAASSGAQSVVHNNVETGVATWEPAASAAGKLPPTGATSGHDAAVGTLNDQVERALAAKDGPVAANLASKLKECDINQRILEVESSQGARPNADPAVQAVRMERLLEYQRNIASCQTVPGDLKQVRLRLLDLAIQQGVVGAATESFLAGSRAPATLSHVVSDANSGDISALTNVAMYDTKVFGITREEQDAARYALKLAATDADVGTRVATYLKVAESYAVPNSSFDFSGISSAARTKGAETAERLKKRLEQKTS